MTFITNNFQGTNPNVFSPGQLSLSNPQTQGNTTFGGGGFPASGANFPTGGVNSIAQNLVGQVGSAGGFTGNIDANFVPNQPQFQQPLIIQGTGGKGGKKGQGAISVLGGFGTGGGIGGQPLILQGAGGKGGKKGQSNLTVLGGFGAGNPGGTINGLSLIHI